MNKGVFKKNFVQSLVSGISPLIFTIVIIIMVLIGFQNAGEASRAEGLRVLDEAIRRAVIHSYAVDGYFPPSLEHITEVYGIFIDFTRFIVHYDVFAENIMPFILVMER